MNRPIRKIAQTILDAAMLETKQFGTNVSKLQKNPKYPEINTGSSILPATVVSRLITSFCSNQELIGCFNVKLTQNAIAKHYGLSTNSALSVPLLIKRNQIKFVQNIPVVTTERKKLQQAQINMMESIENLRLYIRKVGSS